MKGFGNIYNSLCVLTLVFSSFLLTSCGRTEVNVKYQIDQPKTFEVFQSSTYSTMDGDEEAIGTITSTFAQVTFANVDGKSVMVRKPGHDRSNGYHKNSMPFDLAWRTPVKVVATGEKVESVVGYQAFDSLVVAKLPIPDRWRRQLQGDRYVTEFDRIEKKRWELRHLLLGKVPVKGDITALLKEQGRLPIPLLLIDSVKTIGFHKPGNKECFEYSVWMREREPFPEFIFEQHAFSTKSGEALRQFSPQEASYQTKYSVSLDLETGLPCQEREFKKGTFEVAHRTSGRKESFVAMVGVERLYNAVVP